MIMGLYNPDAEGMMSDRIQKVIQCMLVMQR